MVYSSSFPVQDYNEIERVVGSEEMRGLTPQQRTFVAEVIDMSWRGGAIIRQYQENDASMTARLFRGTHEKAVDETLARANLRRSQREVVYNLARFACSEGHRVGVKDFSNPKCPENVEKLIASLQRVSA